LCIAHREGERVIADVIRGQRPPFDPASVAKEYAKLVREYHRATVVGDSYAPGWVGGAFRDAGVQYQASPKNRSELYLESLPLFTRGLVSIPDHKQLIRELRLLERRTARSGKDSVDHGVSGSDDYANALAGALFLARRQSDDVAAIGWIGSAGPRTYLGDHPGYGLGGAAGSLTNPALAHGPEYSGFGINQHRRGG
jgi:hypothetical protein